MATKQFAHATQGALKELAAYKLQNAHLRRRISRSPGARRRRLTKRLVPVLAALVLGSLLIMGDARTYGGLKAVVVDPATFFNLRSPGIRASGLQHQIKTKIKLKKLALAPPPVREERVLSQVRTPPPTAPELDVPQLALLEVPPELLLTPVDIPLAPFTPFLLEPGLNPPVLTTPGAVPEPSTWMTMMVGMFAVAGLLRRGKRARKRLELPSSAA